MTVAENTPQESTLEWIESPPSFPTPARRALLQGELLAKAGEKDGDTTYTRLLEEVFAEIPELPEAAREKIREIARKRQDNLKAKLFNDPALAAHVGLAKEDELTSVERKFLDDETFRRYQEKMVEVFQQ